MKRYSEKFKNKMIQKLLAPPGRTAFRLAKETGIAQTTLSRWLRESGNGVLAERSGNAPLAERSGLGSSRSFDGDILSGVPKGSKPPTKKKNKWTLREKMRVVELSEGLSEDEIGALIRREGIHMADLEEWRRLGEAEDAASPPTREEKKRIKQLEKQLRYKDRALAEAAALLVLKKKLQTILGDEDDDMNPNDDE